MQATAMIRTSLIWIVAADHLTILNAYACGSTCYGLQSSDHCLETHRLEESPALQRSSQISVAEELSDQLLGCRTILITISTSGAPAGMNPLTFRSFRRLIGLMLASAYRLDGVLGLSAHDNCQRYPSQLFGRVIRRRPLCRTHR